MVVVGMVVVGQLVNGLRPDDAMAFEALPWFGFVSATPAVAGLRTFEGERGVARTVGAAYKLAEPLLFEFGLASRSKKYWILVGVSVDSSQLAQQSP